MMLYIDKNNITTIFLGMVLGVLFPCSLNGQDDFQMLDFNVEQGVYHQAQGTSGMLLSFVYHYRSNQFRLLPANPKIALRKNGLRIYQNNKQLIPLVTNKRDSATIFIPYRDILLLGGKHKEVELTLSFPNKLHTEKAVFDYEQPSRYLVQIDIHDGAVKKKLRQYDQSLNPHDWLPDNYFVFTTNEGTTPIYQSPVRFNSYQLDTTSVRFHILAGEKLHWHFYDKDGAEKQRLGTYDSLNAVGNFSDKVIGEMFDDIRSLTFTYNQKQLAHQPITIYSDGPIKRNGKSGVGITVEYDLSNSYIGAMALPTLRYYDKQGNDLELAYYESLKKTPPKGDSIRLKRSDALHYFIPFYAWDSEVKEIAFAFDLGDSVRTRSVNHLIRKPIVFDKYIYYSGVELEEDYTFQGAKGIRLALRYQVRAIHQYAYLTFSLTQPNGKPLPFPIHQIYNQESGFLLKKFPFKVKQPREEDAFFFFIPYKYLDSTRIKAELNIHPGFRMNLINQTSEILQPPSNHKDIDITINNTKVLFHKDDFGQSINLNVKTPALFTNESKLHWELYRNKERFDQFQVDGINNKTATIEKPSLRPRVHIPYRYLKANDQLHLVAYATDLQGKIMSDTLHWKWQVQKKLWNRKVDFELKALRIDNPSSNDTTTVLPWHYVIKVGSATYLDKPVAKRMNRKTKQAYSRTFLVHREDMLEVSLVHQKNKRKIIVWKGDLDKWGQEGYKTILKKVGPIKRVKLVGKTDYTKEQSKKQNEQTTATN